MKISINHISIPPHISTTWSNVESLQGSGEDGIIFSLKNGTSVAVNNLSKTELEKIYSSHSEYLDLIRDSSSSFSGSSSGSTSGRVGAEEDLSTLNKKDSKAKSAYDFTEAFSADSLESMPFLGGALQHNEDLANTPPLPDAIVKKIHLVVESIGIPRESVQGLDASQPHCNCPYCQISRVISKKESTLPSSAATVENDVPDVSEEELSFKTWEITAIKDLQYKVCNTNNMAESYQVYLGTPVGCTCGQKNCEHIKAVLES